MAVNGLDQFSFAKNIAAPGGVGEVGSDSAPFLVHQKNAHNVYYGKY
jgi:hypothetical protein